MSFGYFDRVRLVDRSQRLARVHGQGRHEGEGRPQPLTKLGQPEAGQPSHEILPLLDHDALGGRPVLVNGEVVCKEDFYFYAICCSYNVEE